jgi:hypothetical protein
MYEASQQIRTVYRRHNELNECIAQSDDSDVIVIGTHVDFLPNVKGLYTVLTLKHDYHSMLTIMLDQ